MRERRDAIALAILLLSLGGLAVLLRPQAAERNVDDPRASSYRISPSGARALYLVLDELDVPARAELRPFGDDTARGVLAVLAPVEAATPREAAALAAWVRAGGTLIFGAGGNDARILQAVGLRTFVLEHEQASASTAGARGVTARPERHAWTMGVDSVHGFTRAFSPSSRAFVAGGAEVLLRAPGGEPTVIVYPLGDGRVIAWSDVAPLTNRRLRDGSAALLFVRSARASLADGEYVRFDEYHQGYRQAGPWRALRGFLARTGTGRAVLQAMLAALALLLLYGHRFGAPLRERAERRRSPLEYVEAVAGAYRRARARNTTRRLLMTGLERRLARRMLRPDGALAPAALAAGPAGDRLAEEWARGEKGDLVALAAAIDDYTGEARRWKQAV